MTYFLDTNTCIFHLNGSAPGLSNRLENTPTTSVAIPSMVAAELVYGAEKSAKRDQNLKKIGMFLSLYDVVPFDLLVAQVYGAIRRELENTGRSISGNDLTIAATVLAHKGTLVTNNTGEFARVRGLLLEDWK